MKILVTGGAGFIGSHIVESLIEKGWEVVVYDNLSSGSLENLSHISSHKLTFIRGDILDYNTLEQAMRGCDYVSHQAAQLEIFLGIEDPERDLYVNTIGTLNVLKAARKNGVKKVINASSACVYGQTKKATREDDLTEPNWEYGVSKLAAEKYANIFNNYKDLPVVNLRYSIVYGEREWFRRVLPIFIKRAIMKEPLVVFGEGNAVRDFIYVKDVVDFHNICLESDKANGQTFNVGTGVPISIRELAELISSLFGNIPVIFEEVKEGEFSKLVEGKKRNSAELNMMLLDMSKAKSMFSWEAKTPLVEGILREYEWAKQNLHRWEKVFSTRW